MNLQRYVSSVYCESISDKDFMDELDKAVAKIDKTEKYTKQLVSYTQLYTPYINKEKNDQAKGANKPVEGANKNAPEKVNKDSEATTYILDKLFFNILFGNTIGNLYKKNSHTIVIFPVFKDTDSIKRLLPSIKDIYTPILKVKDLKSEFLLKETNLYLFIPAFSDAEESMEEFTDDLTVYFTRAFEFILQQKQTVTVGGITQIKDTKLDNIIYTLDKNKQIFTGYYNKKLSVEKNKALDGIVVKFVEKLGAKLTNVKDPIVSLTKEESIRKFKADGYGMFLPKLNPFFSLLEIFLDYYKKTNDREYLKLAASSDSQSFFKLYYRINNTDNVEIYDKIRPGSNYVYQISEINNPQLLNIGYFIEKEGLTNQYIFREYTGLTNAFKKARGDIRSIVREEVEAAEEEDSKDISIPKEIVIETKIVGNRIYFRRVTQAGTGKFFGRISQIMTLHIYEKYKWFKFNDMSGELPPETKIKFYKNLLFDKEAVVDFLKEINQYDDKLSIGVEFLKINKDNRLLVQLVNFLLTKKKDTHVYIEDALFAGKQELFVEKIKKAIVDMIFQPNKLIYTTNVHSDKKKEDISKNYKMIGYDYYSVKDDNDLDKHFDKIIIDDEEIKYCKKSKCEDIRQEITDKNCEFGIVIVDITKENIEVVEQLKKKTKCKKLRKTIRRQMQPYVEKMPQLGGRTRSRLRSRRRKNRHKS